MSYTLAGIAPQIAALLNDSAQSNWTNAVLLPYAKNACDELQLELEINGILALEKISSVITVPAGTTTITYSSSPALPSDLLEPQRLKERLAGSSDLFVTMLMRMWPPDILPSDSLRYWDWREQAIHFVGSTLDREIEIFYLKSAVSITADTTPITINNSQQFIINRTAALGSMFVGENETRYAALNQIAATCLDKLIGIGVKNKQRTRTRRRPFRLFGRRNWV